MGNFFISTIIGFAFLHSFSAFSEVIFKSDLAEETQKEITWSLLKKCKIDGLNVEETFIHIVQDYPGAQEVDNYGMIVFLVNNPNNMNSGNSVITVNYIEDADGIQVKNIITNNPYNFCK